MTAGVVTGEAVALDVRLAHWPSRLLAKLIDLILQFILLFLLLLSRGSAGVRLGRRRRGRDRACASSSSYSSATTCSLRQCGADGRLGKAALGLRVVRDDGGPVRFRHALVRGIMFPLEGWGPALFASIFSRRGKRFGDMLAGTIVVQERVPGVTAPPVQMPAPLAWWATTLDLSRLDDDLALACRQFLARQNELHPAARDAMGNELMAAVFARVTPPPPPGTPGWAYLSAVLAERRRREEQRMYAAAPVSAVRRRRSTEWPQSRSTLWRASIRQCAARSRASMEPRHSHAAPTSTRQCRVMHRTVESHRRSQLNLRRPGRLRHRSERVQIAFILFSTSTYSQPKMSVAADSFGLWKTCWTSRRLHLVRNSPRAWPRSPSRSR